MSDPNAPTAPRQTRAKRVEILGTWLDAHGFDDVIKRLVEAARDRDRLRAHFCTVHTVTDARSNAGLRAAFESAQMLAMDGMPLVWVARRRGARAAERVSGPDVMLALADRGRAAGLRHYFLGGAPGVPEAVATSLEGKLPGLSVAGTHSPPFAPISSEQDEAIVAAVNAARPDVLWIGLGSPRQEIWAADHQPRLDVPVILPVGAAFDFHSGRIRRAPKWMQGRGLEWLFRLAVDPRRLAWRYLRTNILFLWLLGRDALGRRASGVRR
jgi:N-acetylglucosaminyldiphosphoundecaprenol N-acetyl-beta-D-mannosaminyltransferase